MPVVDVLDSTMFFQDGGSGRPVVFLHGNPTSSYLWRHVMPTVESLGRCLAPDLIGMGESGKPSTAYRFADHARYLDAWFETRLPLLQWSRELPVDGEPADVVARVEAYDGWLTSTLDVPKLLLTFDPGPGTMVSGPLVDWCKENIAGLDVHPCGLAGHHAPEDQPGCIGDALVAWIGRHGLQSGVGVGS